MGVEGARSNLGVSAYMLNCKGKGLSKAAAFRAFLDGKTADGDELSLGDYLLRGAALRELRQCWLDSWAFMP